MVLCHFGGVFRASVCANHHEPYRSDGRWARWWKHVSLWPSEDTTWHMLGRTWGQTRGMSGKAPSVPGSHGARGHVLQHNPFCLHPSYPKSPSQAATSAKQLHREGLPGRSPQGCLQSEVMAERGLQQSQAEIGSQEKRAHCPSTQWFDPFSFDIRGTTHIKLRKHLNSNCLWLL